MKKYIIISFIIFFVYSCSFKCIKEDEFKEVYFKKLDKIIKFDSIITTNHICSVNEWYVFDINVMYLNLLTNHKFRLLGSEPSMYSDTLDLIKDIEELKMWYNNNKCNMTINIADSIVNMKLDSLGGGGFFCKGIGYENIVGTDSVKNIENGEVYHINYFGRKKNR